MYGVSKLDICEDVALISFSKAPSGVPVLADVFAHFAESGVNIDMISQSAPGDGSVGISFTCAGADMVRVLALTKELGARYPALRPLVTPGNCKLQLFGEEMREMSGVFARAVGALRSIPAELRLVTTSEVDISLLIDSPHAEEAAAALRAEFAL